MKLVCSKSNLLNGVQIVSKAVPNKTTMSILECKDRRLTLSKKTEEIA